MHRQAAMLLLAVFAYLTCAGSFDWPGRSVIVKTLVLMAFSMTHAALVLGRRKMLVFFVLSAVISWVFEEVGVRTGAIYGPYHYSDQLGFKLGHVPVLIPLTWFAMIYPAYVVANALVGQHLFGTSGRRRHVLWLALVSAVVMTCWDVVMDPVMSAGGYWVWEQPGGYFGVPFQNYLGWIATTFTIYTAYRMYEWRSPNVPSAAEFDVAIAAMPVLAYGLASMFYVVAAEPTELRIIACFVMGMPTLLALGRVFGSSQGLRSEV